MGRGWIYSETFKYRDTSAHNIWCITTIDRKVVTAKRLKRTISDRDVLSLGLVSELETSTDAPVNQQLRVGNGRSKYTSKARSIVIDGIGVGCYYITG